MKQDSLAIEIDSAEITSTGRATLPKSLFRRSVLKHLSKIRNGKITLIEAGVHHHFGKEADPLSTTIRVHSPDFYKSLALGGGMGAAESYLDGQWQCDNLTALFQIFLRNKSEVSGLAKSPDWLKRFRDKIYDYYNRNTVRGSKRNIEAHYDLSNEFYQLWLDPTMTYSSGIFENEESTMEEASIEKLDRICRKLDISSEDHILEIGTGWGSFSIHAAKTYGCKVTTTTISENQYDLAKQRIKESGLDHLITIIKEDYRHLEGEYDKIVSIEMIEAVGHQFIPEFVETLNRLVKPGGKVAIQAITINEKQYSQYRKSVDFIKKYVFPGGNLVSVNHLLNVLKDNSTFRPIGMEEIGLHYAQTLNRWRESFEARLKDVRGQGFSDRFIRLWRYYLTYCEAGFLEKHIGTSQLVFEKV